MWTHNHFCPWTLYLFQSKIILVVGLFYLYFETCSLILSCQQCICKHCSKSSELPQIPKSWLLLTHDVFCYLSPIKLTGARNNAFLKREKFSKRIIFKSILQMGNTEDIFGQILKCITILGIQPTGNLFYPIFCFHHCSPVLCSNGSPSWKL